MGLVVRSAVVLQKGLTKKKKKPMSESRSTGSSNNSYLENRF
jgi:hypothetical protein